jgi:polyisoprenoid-binding protein YceI
MTRYDIDPSAATISFNASTSLHPVVAAAPVSGWFEADIGADGFAPESSIAGRLEIPVDDISSGNPLYDAETRRRIDVKAHPLIVAEITTTLAVDGESASVEGTVDFYGETVLLEGELTLAPGPLLIGEGTVDIRWWGLRPPRLLAFRVEPNVVIGISLPLVETS